MLTENVCVMLCQTVISPCIWFSNTSVLSVNSFECVRSSQNEEVMVGERRGRRRKEACPGQGPGCVHYVEFSATKPDDRSVIPVSSFWKERVKPGVCLLTPRFCFGTCSPPHHTYVHTKISCLKHFFGQFWEVDSVVKSVFLQEETHYVSCAHLSAFNHL